MEHKKKPLEKGDLFLRGEVFLFLFLLCADKERDLDLELTEPVLWHSDLL